MHEAGRTTEPALANASPLREVWTIAWPTVLTMTSYTVMQWLDKLMVGQVGPTELAAQSNGGLWSFTVLSFALGVLTVVNTYVSQHLGAGTPRQGARYAWAALWLGLIVWLAVMVPIFVVVFGAYVVLAARLRPLLTSPRAVRRVHRASAVLMAAMAVLIALR